VIRRVTRRELLARTRAKSYRIATGLLVLAAVAATVAVAVLDDEDDGARSVSLAAVDVPSEVGAALESVEQVAGERIDITVEVHDDRAEAEQALRDGDVDAVLAGDELVWPDERDPVLGAAIVLARERHAIAELAARTGIAPAEITGMQRRAAVEETTLEDDEPEAIRTTVAFLTTLVTFGLIVSYGQMIAASVVEEKSTRVVEVLLARISARELLAGKVLGVGAAVAVQVVIVLAGLAGALAATRSVDVPSEVWGALPVLLGCLVLGFGLYAVLFAAAGSLVSRQEDVQQTTMPLMIPIFAAYFYATASLPGDRDGLMVTLAYVPITSPVTLPGVYARGWISELGAAASLLLLALTTIALLRLSARVYERSLLHTGSRVPLRQVLRSSSQTPLNG
jgi:ABC-2 type transport system permease protein